MLKHFGEVKKCYKILIGKPKVEGKDMVVDKMILHFLTNVGLPIFNCYLLNQTLDNITHRNY
jgi:hypothetical protein